MTKSDIGAVYLFVGGMVMVFDTNGEQMPAYQGPAREVATAVLRDAPAETRFCFGKWRGEGFTITREEWAIMAEPWRNAE